MADQIQEVDNAIELLRKITASAIVALDDFGKRQSTDTREKIAVYFLQRSIDIAAGCVTVAKAHLPDSLAILERSLLENLFSVCWALLSDENAQAFSAAAVSELKIIAKINLEQGHLLAKDTKTGENRRGATLAAPEMQGVARLPGFERMAKNIGLEEAYSSHYRFISMYAHGNTFGIAPMSIADELYASLSAANSVLECINLVVRNWFVDRKQTEATTINNILYS